MMTEELLAKDILLSVRLNPDRSPCYGFVRNTKGSYATASFSLEYMTSLFDFISGHIVPGKPYPIMGWAVDEEFLGPRFYDFWLDINDKQGDTITADFWFISSANSGDAKPRHIRLMEWEQKRVVKTLDEQCLQIFGKSCRQMLEEARKRMAPSEQED